ncbi:MAG TPA: hypothetical protein VFG30_24090 [Polyangiales bacterium]|nr:hypothetical protein [Polyangiales bacterium]
MHRLYAYAVSVAALLIVGWPATRNLDLDGFPLSTYPMFAYPKGRVASVTSALAVSANGASAPVPPKYVANAETMQAFRTLQAAAAKGRRESGELCRAIASRLKSASDPKLRDAQHVEIVTGRVDAIDFLAGRATPSSRRLHARCDVEQKQP